MSPIEAGPLTDATGRSSIKLKAKFTNSGNTGAAKEAVVCLYNGHPTGKGVQIGPDFTISLMGCGDDTQDEDQWPQTAPGEYKLFVEIRPWASVLESDAENNVLKATVNVASTKAQSSSQWRRMRSRPTHPICSLS